MNVGPYVSRRLPFLTSPDACSMILSINLYASSCGVSSSPFDEMRHRVAPFSSAKEAMTSGGDEGLEDISEFRLLRKGRGN